MNIWNWFSGEIEVEIRGLALERFLNQMNEKGIKIKGSKVTPKGIVVNIKPSDFKKLPELLRNRSCRLKIINKKGLPFLLHRAKRRKMFLTGSMVALLMIYLLTCFIWFIDVRGLENVNKDEIMEIIARSGVHRGKLKDSISLEELESILVQHPFIVFADAYYLGTKLIIDIAEKRIIPDETNNTNIVAAKDGIITDVILLKGTGMVSEGDTVKKGDLLILGEEKGQKIRARGIIRANVWYEGKGIQPLQIRNFMLTGASKWSYSLRLGNREYFLWGAKEPGFEKYRVEREVKSFSLWRNLNFPIELIKEIYLELNEEHVTLDNETAFKLAEEAAYRELVQKIAPDGRILKVRVMQKDIINSRAVVRVLLEVEEEISKEVSSERG